MKNCSVQNETNDKKNEKQKGFIKDPEQAWYKGPLYLMLRIDMLFQTNRTIKRKS